MEEKSDNPPSSPSISTIATDSETEAWEVVAEEDDKNGKQKQENPKITIDKAVDESDDDDKEKNSSLNVNVGSSSSRVEDIKDNRYEDFSDGISVISESELECGESHHSLDTTLETDAKQELVLKHASMVCAVKHEPLPLLEYLQQYFMSNQMASVAILTLIVAVLGGIFCQIGMMFSSPGVSPTSTGSNVNLLICQNKLIEFERDNANLRIEISILQKEIEEFQIKVTKECPTEVPLEEEKAPVRQKAKNGQYNGKRVKTKYDSFKRPPVAAGGEEDAFIHVDKPLIVDEEDTETPFLNDFIEPLQNLWTEEAPKDDILVENEPIDTEIETNPTLNELPDEENDEPEPEPEPERNVERRKEKENGKKYKQEQYDNKKSQKSKKYEEKSNKEEKNYQEKSKNDYKKRSKESSGMGEAKFERKSEKYQKQEGSANGEDKIEGKKNFRKYKKNNQESKHHHKDNHHDHDKNEESEEENDFWKENKEKHHQKRYKNDASGEKKRRDFQKRHEKDSHEKDWHEDRMKNREKSRDKEEKEDWYVERKKNREKHRETREKDSNWYIERNLERELLRSREPEQKHESSKERSK